MLEGNALGLRLRALRQKRHYSLSEAGKRSGLSPSFISLVETGKRDITFSRLIRLAQAYGAEIGDLVSDEDAARADLIVVREGDTERVASHSEGIEVRFLTRGTTRLMMPIVERFAPGGKVREWVTHEGEEFIYVLEGRVALWLKGQEPVHLEVGDSAYFSATHPHRYENIEDGPTTALFVATPPSL